ncbi:max dimerization protein 3 [Lissotriton helveticus]
MDQISSNIQVLLQAAQYLERREREAEHGYASMMPYYRKSSLDQSRRPRSPKTPDTVRSVHNELEKHRRAQLRRCLEQLKQQVPMNSETSRHTTLSLLHKARMHIKKLEEQELRACKVKDKLRSEQQQLRQRLEQLLPSTGTERTRADSLDSSLLSSEPSDSDQEDIEVDVEGVVFSGNEIDPFPIFGAGTEHSYSNASPVWL